MGAFIGLKSKFLNVLNSRKEQNEDEIRSIIEGLKKELFICGDCALIKILEEYQKYPKIGFGKEALVEPELVNLEFSISPDEIVIAVIKGKVRITDISWKDKLIITNKALYIKKNIACKNYEAGYSNAEINRVEFDVLKNGVICLLKKSQSVVVVSPEYTGTLIMESTINPVLSGCTNQKAAFDILLDIQESIWGQCDIEKYKEKNLTWFINKQKSIIYENRFDDFFYEISFSLKNGYGNKGKLIYLMQSIVLLDEKVFKKRLDSLYIDEHEINEFITETRVFLENYIDDISSTGDKIKFSSYFFDKTYADIYTQFIFSSNIGDSIKRIFANSVDEYIKKINFHLSIKKAIYKIEDLKRYAIENNINVSEEYIIKSVLYSSNFVMKTIWNEIKNDGNYRTEWLDKKDAFGFTALHYSLLMNNNRLSKELAKHQSELYRGSNINKEFIEAREYTTLCGFLGRYDYEIYLELIKDIPEVKILISTKRILEVKKEIYQIAVSNLRKKINSIERSYQRVKQIESLSASQIQNMKKISQTNKETLKSQLSFKIYMLQSIEESLIELEYEIKETARKHYVHVCEYVRNIKNENKFGYKYIFYFYENFQRIIYNLNTDWDKFFCFDAFGNWFQIPDELKDIYDTFTFSEKNQRSKQSENESSGKADFRNDKENEKNKNDSKNNFDKPYGNSWFSPKAHQDLNMLKKEYNVLVKKYHPDNNPNGTGAFVSIQQERCIIIDNL